MKSVSDIGFHDYIHASKGKYGSQARAIKAGLLFAQRKKDARMAAEELQRIEDEIECAIIDLRA